MGGFGILDLPIETRLRVYHHFFNIKYRPTDVDWVKVDTQTGRRLVRQDIWPLFEVCRQIYDEVMPEYYAWTRFHFNALVTLQNTMKSHHNFNAYVRDLVFNPALLLPGAEDLLQLPNLHIFAIANLTCHEPLGTPSGKALAYSTLYSALYKQDKPASELEKMQRAMQLFESISQVADSHKRQIHLLLRFGYSYIEKTKHPNTWGGKSAKRYRAIEYDLTDDIFVIVQPDDDEDAIIRNDRQSKESSA